MTINLQKPDITELKPRITVFGVGGGGGNAVNNMISSGLDGVDFVVANTDAQALTMSKSERLIQMGVQVTEGLGAGSQPEIGAAAAEECIDEINDHLSGTHMAFVTAGMGGGTGTGAAPVVARAARDLGILTVGVVTKPFSFEGKRRMTLAEAGITELQKNVDTLIVIPNQNLFRVANDKTTFADAFSMADEVLYSGVACITDLMVKEGLINLDFADVRSVMREMGRAMMGTGEASGEGRAMAAAEAAISNPLLDETSMAGSKGLLISITGGRDMTLFEVDEAATRIREEVDQDANIILGATFDESLEGIIRVSVVATGIDTEGSVSVEPNSQRMFEAAERMRQSAAARTSSVEGDIFAKKPLVERADPEGAIVDDLAIATPEAPAEMDTTAHAVPFEAENADFADAISDSDFASALEEQIEKPSMSQATEAPRMAPVQQAQPQQEPVRMAQPSIVQRPAAGMPLVKDFPPVQQRQPEAAPTHSEENGAIGLLKRLTNGFGNSSHEAEAQPVRRPVEPSPAQAVHNSTQAVHNNEATARGLEGSGREGNNPYAPPRSGSLDMHGRLATPAKTNSEEDQLDIPAFLRRQVN